MEFFDSPKKEDLPKNDVEVVDKQKQEFHLLGRERKVPGHTMFSINLRTGEIKEADIEEKTEVVYKQGQVTKRRLVIEKDCIYRQALNKKNFIKRLIREGILIKQR